MQKSDEEIKRLIKDIETIKEVKILFAVESGSRAWGFESVDSDYDVRFVYTHNPEWYLSVDDRRDVIEYTDEPYDLSGWELRKALKLLKKSNPPLLEWLRSPMVYKSSKEHTELQNFGHKFFSPKSCMYHYLHMANNNYKDYLQGDEVWVKKYFYVLRPIFACEWIAKHNNFPPLEFEKVLKNADLTPAFRCEMTKLLQEKKQGYELKWGRKLSTINAYLKEGLDHFQEYVKTIPGNKIDSKVLDEFLYRTILEEKI